MRKCILDISKKRVGIAISDDQSKFIIKSSCIYYNNNFSKLQYQLKIFYQKYTIGKTLIGLPYSTANDIQVLLIKHVAHNLRNIIKPYEFVNENFSTVDAICFQMANKEEYKDFTIDEIVCRRLFEFYKDI